jgi:hypothetical protein
MIDHSGEDSQLIKVEIVPFPHPVKPTSESIGFRG